MFDPESSRYRWRALFPRVDLSLNTETGREERKGVELAQAKAVRLQQDSLLEGGLRRVVATVIEGDSERETMIETDVDGRVTYAQCDCSHFRHHKMRQGPCRHIVATTLAESMP